MVIFRTSVLVNLLEPVFLKGDKALRIIPKRRKTCAKMQTYYIASIYIEFQGTRFDIKRYIVLLEVC